MLNSIKKLDRCRILAVDGEAGRVRDVYLDDDRWVVRYLVVDSSDWLSEQSVLISPSAATSIDWETRAMSFASLLRAGRSRRALSTMRIRLPAQDPRKAQRRA